MSERAGESGNETPLDPRDGPGDPEAVARVLCLRQLDARARTRAELERYLAREGVPDESAARVLDRFAEVGLIDDRALARSFVIARHEQQGMARRALALKLRQRGVKDDVIDSAVEQIDGASELSAARRLVERRLAALPATDAAVLSRRLLGLLGRKGYSPGLAYRVVREALADQARVTGDTNDIDLVALDLD